MGFQFKIEHIALQPHNPSAARALLEDLGLTEWTNDRMHVHGEIWEQPHCGGAVDLDFNYQADCIRTRDDGVTRRVLELEIMNCAEGDNWMDGADNPYFISHFGMQVTNAELAEVAVIMNKHGIKVAQDVVTIAHKNPHLALRRYRKVIYDTRRVLGVDLEFNVLIKLD